MSKFIFVQLYPLLLPHLTSSSPSSSSSYMYHIHSTSSSHHPHFLVQLNWGDLDLTLNGHQPTTINTESSSESATTTMTVRKVLNEPISMLKKSLTLKCPSDIMKEFKRFVICFLYFYCVCLINFLDYHCQYPQSSLPIQLKLSHNLREQQQHHLHHLQFPFQSAKKKKRKKKKK